MTPSPTDDMKMDNNTIKTGFRELDQLAADEYHQSLAQVFAEPDKDKVVERLGRLVGVLIKEPFADVKNLSSPSSRTAAYRSWQLKDVAEFNPVAAKSPWQYLLFDRVRSELYPNPASFSTYGLAQYAQFESGFFGLYAQALRKYICGDKAIRKKVDEAFKAYSKIGGSLKAPTPEGLVGAGGLTLGVYLVQTVPLLGMAGAPVIAAVVLIIYVLGIDAFCRWSETVRTDETEKH
jgi:hypothetical protein